MGKNPKVHIVRRGIRKCGRRAPRALVKGHKKIFNFFWCPFRVPAGLDAHIFESLSQLYAPQNFSAPLYRYLNKRFYSGTPNLKRHSYANTTFGFPSSPYVPSDFFRFSTSILTILTNDFTQALPTSNFTLTPTQRSDFPRCLAYPRIFPAPLPPLLQF